MLSYYIIYKEYIKPFLLTCSLFFFLKSIIAFLKQKQWQDFLRGSFSFIIAIMLLFSSICGSTCTLIAIMLYCFSYALRIIFSNEKKCESNVKCSYFVVYVVLLLLLFLLSFAGFIGDCIIFI